MESKDPIPAPRKSLGNILQKGAAGIQAELIGVAPIHKIFGGGMAGSAVEQQSVQEIEQRLTGKVTSQLASKFRRGDDVVDVERKKKGTIIRELKAAEDGQRRFEIVNSRGDAWKQKASQLRPRS